MNSRFHIDRVFFEHFPNFPRLVLFVCLTILAENNAYASLVETVADRYNFILSYHSSQSSPSLIEIIKFCTFLEFQVCYTNFEPSYW
jgi:hypothetical protein